MSQTRTLFGTDGIRGTANAEPVTPETTMRLGQALVQEWQLSNPPLPMTVVIGRDTRRSGPMLEAALVAGLTSAGADVVLAGVVPTPAVAWLTRKLKADAGIVVSASHNPFGDNGIKIFGADGFKLSDQTEMALEAALRSASATRPTGVGVGRVLPMGNLASRYARGIAAVAKGCDLHELSLVLDCANGAASMLGEKLFAKLGCRVTVLAAQPDGININAACGAVHPDRLRQAVRRQNASFGLALDGDADRAIFVDEIGEGVDGDAGLAMLALDMADRGTLRGAAVVATVMSNLGLERALTAHGLPLVRTAVGDRYVVEAMRQRGCNVGGEQSGHLVFLDHASTGDGLLAGVLVARLLAQSKRSLSELAAVMQRLPQTLINVRVRARQDLQSVAAVRAAMSEAEAALNERGRILVRYSGTEPLVRVMVEGDTANEVEHWAQLIAAAIRSNLGE
jgi:phosphoglucosamine mutase